MNCKYGAKGNGCSFRHPPKCLKYIKHTEKNSRGCKKGSSCERYHPKLCYNSVNSGTCNREDCHFQHLQGTKRNSWEASGVTRNQQSAPTQAQRLNAGQGKQFQSAQRIPTISIGSRAHSTNLITSAEGENSQSPTNPDIPNFLIMQHQIQQMQTQILSILQRDNQP